MRVPGAPLLVAVLMAGTAGCGRPEAASDPGSSFIPGTRAHWMPTRASLPVTGFAFPPPNAKLLYFGGKVIPGVQADAIFWGVGVDPTTTSQIGGYFTAVPNSTYIDWLSEYNTNITAQDGGAGSNQSIGRGGLFASGTITPTIATGANLTDAQIQQELDAQITSGVLPAPNDNLLYVAYFAPGVSISQGGGTSCNAFCGYHSTFLHAGVEAYYAVIPDVATCAGACDFVPGDAFASITAITSHEVVEAITDPEVGMTSSVQRPVGWYDPTGSPPHGEIGDICLAITGQVGNYTVQQEWSNAQNACVINGPANSGGGGGNGCGCALAGERTGPGAGLACGLLAALALLSRRRDA